MKTSKSRRRIDWRWVSGFVVVILGVVINRHAVQSNRRLEYFRIFEAKDHPRLRQFLNRDKTLVKLWNEYGDTGLHLAVENSSPECVELLLSHGAEPNAYSPRLSFPLHYAASYGKLEIVRQLIAAGADLERQAPKVENGNAFHRACEGGNVAVVAFLLRSGADPNARKIDEGGWGGQTPLMYALPSKEDRFNGIPIAKMLLAAGADPTLKTERGETLLDRVSAMSRELNPSRDAQIEFVKQAVEEWNRKHRLNVPPAK